MLRIIIFIIIMGLVTACSSSQSEPTKIKLVTNDKMFQMSRQEVINAIEDCRSVKLRPVLYHGRILVTDRYVPIVVDIQCAPTHKDY
jgi:type IV secretory pathway TraG/TraD family ATPase VirD4